jgi:uncharacterized protein YycO
MINKTYTQLYDLKPGDVIVVPKSIFNLVEHYIIYLGKGLYSENDRFQGVRVINAEQVANENPFVKRIRRFEGNDYQRSCAVQRAWSLVGKAYNLTHFNCEHYANHVQYNTEYSAQSSNGWFAAISLGLIVFGLSSNRR